MLWYDLSGDNYIHMTAAIVVYDVLQNEDASLLGRPWVWLKGSGGQLHFFGLLDE